MDLLERPHVDVTHYSYPVMWSTADGEFLATCLEFPSVSSLDEDRNAAIDGLESLLREIVEDMTREGEKVPEPLGERRYSGKFNVRVGERLHRDLAMHAAEDGMSLNQYVVARLAGR